MDIDIIRVKILLGEWRFTFNALEQADARKISEDDVLIALAQGEILEDYPDDPRGPSCLVLGHARGKPLHVVCGFHDSTLIIITVYWPEPTKWVDERTRRRESE